MELEDRALDRIALRLALLLESGRNCGRAAEDDTDRLCTMLLLELLELARPIGAARDDAHVRRARTRIARRLKRREDLVDRALFRVLLWLDLVSLATGEEEGDRQLARRALRFLQLGR